MGRTITQSIAETAVPSSSSGRSSGSNSNRHHRGSANEATRRLSGIRAGTAAPTTYSPDYPAPPPFPSRASYAGQAGYSASQAGTVHHSEQLGERRILGETVIETETTVPHIEVEEETVNRVVVVPEVHRRERVVEKKHTNRERIVEVEKPMISQTIIEVPEVKIVQNVHEQQHTIIQEKVVERPVTHYQEVITYKPKKVENVIVEEIEKHQIVEVPVERIVEVPEYLTRTVYKEVPKDYYVDVPVAKYVDIEVPHDVTRNLPVPIQSVTQVDFMIPKIKPLYETVHIPVYVARFIEVPVPVEQIDEETKVEAEVLLEDIAHAAAQQYPSLCGLENLGAQARGFTPRLLADPTKVLDSWRKAVTNAIHFGEIPVTVPATSEHASLPRSPSFG